VPNEEVRLRPNIVRVIKPRRLCKEETCGTTKENEKYIRHIDRKTSREATVYLEHREKDRWIILKWILKTAGIPCRLWVHESPELFEQLS
jgi:hypothetical protein